MGIALFSKQAKPRLQKWYQAHPEKTKKKLLREVMTAVLGRGSKTCCVIEEGDNELLTLEIIHNYVELLDQYFGSVCELDIIYNYEKVYFILDEYLMAGEIVETSKKSILNAIRLQDFLQEEETPQGLFEDAGLG